MGYNHEWDSDKCYAVLNRYHNRCVVKLRQNRPRGRGNPPEVLHAVQCLKNMWAGGKVCEMCKYTNGLQLHHVDGQWWNYQLENLQFLCKPCHLTAHGGCWKNLLNGDIPMKWTEDKLAVMKSEIVVVCQKTYNKTPEEAREARLMSQVYTMLSTRSETLFGMKATPVAIQKVYEKRVLGRGTRSSSTNNSRSRNTSSLRPASSTVYTVSVADAIRLGRVIEIFEKSGITLSFNSQGV